MEKEINSSTPITNSASTRVSIVEFFAGLSDREKLLCQTFNSLLCAGMPQEVSDKIDRAVSDFNPDSFKNDPETQWLYGVYEMADAIK